MSPWACKAASLRTTPAVLFAPITSPISEMVGGNPCSFVSFSIATRVSNKHRTQSSFFLLPLLISFLKKEAASSLACSSQGKTGGSFLKSLSQAKLHVSLDRCKKRLKRPSILILLTVEEDGFGGNFKECYEVIRLCDSISEKKSLIDSWRAFLSSELLVAELPEGCP